MTVTLEPRDIAIGGLVTSFVKHLYPGHMVVSIEYSEQGVPDEGFFPTVKIYPFLMGNRPELIQTLHLNVWIGDGEYVICDGVTYDFHPTAMGAYGMIPSQALV